MMESSHRLLSSLSNLHYCILAIYFTYFIRVYHYYRRSEWACNRGEKKKCTLQRICIHCMYVFSNSVGKWKRKKNESNRLPPSIKYYWSASSSMNLYARYDYRIAALRNPMYVLLFRYKIASRHNRHVAGGWDFDVSHACICEISLFTRLITYKSIFPIF